MRPGDAFERICSKAGQFIRASAHKARDGTLIFHPSSLPGGYSAHWTRDFYYMVAGYAPAFTAEEVEAAIRYTALRITGDGVVPDYVRSDGTPRFVVFGSNPPTDNAAFLALTLARHAQLTDSRHLVKELGERIFLALQRETREPVTGLITIDPFSPHSSYGFTDTIAKSGFELYCSLLWWDASCQLSPLLKDAGMKDESEWLQEGAQAIKAHVGMFWNRENALLNAATIMCCQPDVWGSCYAAALGILPPARQKQLLASLLKRAPSYIHRGQVRHILEPTAWEQLLAHVGDFRQGVRAVSSTSILTFSAPGHYQNGAYWPVAAGWAASAFRQVEPDVADGLLCDLAAFFDESGVYECVNTELNHYKEEGYVVSATLPLIGFDKHLTGTIQHFRR